MSRIFYITTPIYYVNAIPHLGHAYTTILADAIARFKRFAGFEVYFLTGTDEHGNKIAQAAEAAGESPQVYADRISAVFQETWRALKITHDQFIRTTGEPHKQVVRRFLEKIFEAGDIYFGEYGGKYCFGCERFYTDRELVDGRCPDHRKEPTYISEKNYFFKMSKYQPWLIEYIESHPDFIRPEQYRNEVLAFLKEPLEDLCISRPKARLSWGIPLPFDEAYVTYVWFDALINYISALGYPDGPLFKKFWPAANHLIAKDILKPHAIYWPTMLKAAGIEPYQHLNVHGYWRLEEGKMSKSVGRVVGPLELADRYGLDVFRYFLLREMAFGLDAGFSEEAMVARLNADLANDLGNLFHRTLTMLERYFDGRVPPPQGGDDGLQARSLEAVTSAAQAIEEFGFNRALATIWELIGVLNRYLDEKAPWALAKDPTRKGELATILYNTAETLRIIAVFLSPFLPEAALKMGAGLGIEEELKAATLQEAKAWGRLRPGTVVRKGEPLFPRVTPSPAFPLEGEGMGGGETPDAEKPTITIEEFRRLDLRVAEVLEAEAIKGSKKLLKLKVRINDEERTVVAGIRESYTPEELVRRKIVLVANLRPTKLMGVESQGMILAAEDDEGRVVLLMPDKDVPPGAKVR